METRIGSGYTRESGECHYTHLIRIYRGLESVPLYVFDQDLQGSRVIAIVHALEQRIQESGVIAIICIGSGFTREQGDCDYMHLIRICKGVA